MTNRGSKMWQHLQLQWDSDNQRRRLPRTWGRETLLSSKAESFAARISTRARVRPEFKLQR